MLIGSMFSGIGALDLACEQYFGAVPAWFVECDPYAKRVLAKRWPGVPIYDDVTKISAADLEPVHIVLGGFPCTDLSLAGTKTGLRGSRSGLFYHMIRLIGEMRDRAMRPAWIVIENVPPLLSQWRAEVEREIGGVGYGVTWAKVAAAHVEGCPHLRWRVFLLCALGGEHRGVAMAGPAPRPGRWPTATAGDAKSSGSRNYAASKAHGGMSLTDAVRPDRVKVKEGEAPKRWASPAARDYRSGTGFDRDKHYPGRDGADQLPEQLKGRLNPAFVEVLMGLPLGFTDLDCDDPVPCPFPAPMIKGLWGESPQYDWEPPRLVTGKIEQRVARLRCLGRAVVPAQVLLALSMASEGPKQSGLFGTP